MSARLLTRTPIRLPTTTLRAHHLPSAPRSLHSFARLAQASTPKHEAKGGETGQRAVNFLQHAKNKVPIKTHLSGRALLNNPLLNKGAAFSREERELFGLQSFLPWEVSTLDEQCERAYQQYATRKSDVLMYSFMQSLRDQNKVLFYNFCLRHLKSILPKIYTPTAGTAASTYSHLFRRPSGCYLSFPGRATMETDLARHGKNEDVDIIIVTDGEAILGIGDQGVGGIVISSAKAALYTLGGGLDPERCLPIVLDVGTNRHELFSDELYMGWKRPRIGKEEYDEFLEQFCTLVREKYPNALLHFEDFGKSNAQRLLDKYSPKQSVFNDDIQGTGAVTLAAIFAGCRATNTKITDQRFCFYGFGTAGNGIADAIRRALELEGLSKEEAAKRFWPIDRNGLLVKGREELTEGQELYARTEEEVKDWTRDANELPELRIGDVIRSIKPTVLIGTSTHARSWKEKDIREMAKHCDRPMIFPLSNPTSLCEADPHDINDWTDGRALMATGSPFPPVKTKDGRNRPIGEANNALVYPGLGLGTVISRAKKLSDSMILAGVKALSALSPVATTDPETGAILPDVGLLRESSVKVATAVANAAAEEGLIGPNAEGGIGEGKDRRWDEESVRELMWDPIYRPLEKSDHFEVWDQ